MFGDWRRAIEDRYGTRGAWCRHYLSAIMYRTGWFRSLERIHWARVERLIFVCKGNICRSPYAEARARSLGLNAISFGLEAEPGLPPHIMACRVAQSRGVALDSLRTRALGQVRFSDGDLLVAMEPTQAWRLTKTVELSAARVQITLLGLWKAPPQPVVADPYGRSAEVFATCFGVVDDAVASIASRLSVGRSQASK